MLVLLLWQVTGSAQTPAATSCRPNVTIVQVTEFGAKGDRTGDNLQAFKDAIAYAAKCSVPVIHVPAGNYSFIPQGPSGGILLGSNLSLVGDGIGKTVLQVVGGGANANFDSLFWVRNQDRVEIKGITFIGNSVAVTNAAGRPLNTYGSALSIFLDAAPSAAANGIPKNLAHFLVADSSFENFNGASWIRVINYNGAYSIADIEIRGNRFVSRESNAVNPSEISFPSNAISITGSLTSTTGLVTNVRISGNTIDASHLKGGIAVWSGVSGAAIVSNTITDAGADATIPNDKGAYAITVYNNAYHYDKDHPHGALTGGSRPDGVRIEHNVITRPKSCGIYVASANRVWIVANKISGQSDPLNQTLPKGAIALVYPLDATVTDNVISSSHIGMTLLGTDHYRIVEANNSVSDIPTGGYRIFPSRGGVPPDIH